MSQSSYESPFHSRYASEEMLQLFSPAFRYQSWRRLWVALAKAQKDLGLSISNEQVAEMQAHETEIDYAIAAKYEEETRHEVIAHIRAFADLCPKARPIIHLGATSCYVMDNGELMQLRRALELVHAKLVQVMRQLADFAKQYAEQPCLGFTHFQPAQLTTVGKRACLWLQDFLMDYQDLEHRLAGLRFLGVKGATGTQASFLALFDGDAEKVHALDERVAAYMGFEKIFNISGQTYTRKQDAQLLDVLSAIATSAHKMATDLRLLCHLREVEEPWGKQQVGSSAMAYKRNPMKSERICALARFCISLAENPKYTAATQWLERSLDDSANRRLCLSEACLSCDSILELLMDVTKGLVVNQGMIEQHVENELPFLATENLLMAAVKQGGDRQEVHECIRTHSHRVMSEMKEEGAKNSLIERLAQDPSFPLDHTDISSELQLSRFVGCAPEQVHNFITNEMTPILDKHRNLTVNENRVKV